MLQGINESKLVACIIGGAGLFILIHALLSPMEPNGGTVHVGACSNSTVLLATLGAAMSSGGFTYFLFGGGKGPSALKAASSPEMETTTAVGDNLMIASKLNVQADPSEGKERDYDLILRLLSGDDRIMFRTIVESGGEALQKDLILRTNMSNAKVSRVLDRLEGMSLITKERYGSTNRIEIKLDRRTRSSSDSSFPLERTSGTR